MHEINLTEKKAIADFFKNGDSVMVTDKHKVIYINEEGVETAFKVNEGDVITKEQITHEELKAEIKKKK